MQVSCIDKAIGNKWIPPVLERKGNFVSNIFRFLADEDKLTDELFAFIRDSSADSRNERAIVSVLHEVLPQMVSVAECMLLDGVEERHYVADYVHAVLNGADYE